MQLMRTHAEFMAWSHGPVGLGLQGSKLYVFSLDAADPARFNAEVSAQGVRMLVGRKSSLLRALIALALESPPATVAAVAANSRALHAALPVGRAQGAAEDAFAASPIHPL